MLAALRKMAAGMFMNLLSFALSYVSLFSQQLTMLWNFNSAVPLIK
jgi:hypothetical protein